MPRTSPSELTISVTTSPQPPWRFTSRRNAVSVMPAIGAIANGDGRLTDPIFMVLVSYDNAPTVALGPPILYMAAIFHFSSQSDPLPVLTEHIWDKILHTVEYTGLAILFFRALHGEGLHRGGRRF